MQSLIPAIERIPNVEHFGRVAAIQGLLVEIVGTLSAVGIGARIYVEGQAGNTIPCEVVGFHNERALCMPFGPLDGIKMGCRARIGSSDPAVYPDNAWLGRVINAFGEPIDGKGPISHGDDPKPLRASPPPAHERGRGKSVV